jgi:uncharacterized membrane protein
MVSRPRRHSMRRLVLAVLAGLAVAILGLVFLPDSFALPDAFIPPIAWDVTAAVFLILTLVEVLPMDAASTAAVASEEDPSLALDDLILIVASITGLLTVVLVLFINAPTDQVHPIVRAVLGVVSVALAWGVLHTVYLLRYARLYYSEPVGGIDFNSKEPPSYIDFAYVAFGIGMAFQVADTNLQTTSVRRVVLRHALLSFVFATLIVAVTVNLVAGLKG